jgi:hypothetical protein
MPFTVPHVPTGMNIGNSTVPLGVVKRLRRAPQLRSTCSNSKRNNGFSPRTKEWQPTELYIQFVIRQRFRLPNSAWYIPRKQGKRET